jgi:hypothetical protein
MMLPSGNDAAFSLAEYVGRKMFFFENEDYKARLKEDPTIMSNCKSKDALKCFMQEMNK